MAAPSIGDRIKQQAEKPRDSRDVDVTLDATIAKEVEALEQKIDAGENQIGELEEQRDDLDAEREDLKKDLRLADTRPREIEARIAEIDASIAEIRESLTGLEAQREALREQSLVTIRFLKMDGADWAEIASRHPARLDVSVDRLSGYNYHATAREAAPLSGWELRKEDGGEETLEPISIEDWQALFQVLSGREIEWISSTLWDLNDFGPRKKVDAARKALSDGSASRSS